VGFVDYQDEVEQMLRAGVPFTTVEAVVDSAPLVEDEKAALWLLAWSHQPRAAQMRRVQEAIAVMVEA
jgi:hypothetical protein